MLPAFGVVLPGACHARPLRLPARSRPLLALNPGCCLRRLAAG
jgi:hypothetical protein